MVVSNDWEYFCTLSMTSTTMASIAMTATATSFVFTKGSTLAALCLAKAGP